MWSRSIEILNPYEAVRESIEREAARRAYIHSLPVLRRSSALSRLLRRLKGLIAHG